MKDSTYQIINNPTIDKLEPGDWVEIATSWGRGPSVFGEVVSTESNFIGDKGVVDYKVPGARHDYWAYQNQIKKVVKEYPQK